MFTLKKTLSSIVKSLSLYKTYEISGFKVRIPKIIYNDFVEKFELFMVISPMMEYSIEVEHYEIYRVTTFKEIKDSFQIEYRITKHNTNNGFIIRLSFTPRAKILKTGIYHKINDKKIHRSNIRCFYRNHQQMFLDELIVELC